MVSKRKANLDLDWEKNGDDYVAQLPGIPYYTDDTGNGSFVTVTPYDFYGEKHWKAVFTIIVPDGNVFKLNNGDLNLMGRDTADEMMEEVESLRDPGEITYALYMEGYPSTESFPASRKGKHMIRTASKRKAGMSLDWKDTGNGSAYEAQLPEIPGYPGTWYATVAEDDDDYYGEPDYTWYFTIARKDVAGIQGVSILNNYVFGLEEADRPGELMDFIENLSPEDIADKFAEQGYEPTDTTASRKGKHMIRRSDEKTDTRIVENEDGTFTAYCEGDKKTFDDKGKAAEWLADHFNDEYHDKADARRAARRRLMMRAAARRAAMRKAADDDRKDKGFDVSYDKDGKIHVRFDDGSDMDFDDMHDFADYVEGPDADEKPVDKEEAARARHAARVALMRRRAARVASRPVARHAMRQDDGHPYL